MKRKSTKQIIETMGTLNPTRYNETMNELKQALIKLLKEKELCYERVYTKNSKMLCVYIPKELQDKCGGEFLHIYY